MVTVTRNKEHNIAQTTIMAVPWQLMEGKYKEKAELHTSIPECTGDLLITSASCQLFFHEQKTDLRGTTYMTYMPSLNT